MQIKKTIWIPVIIGIVSAAIILLVSEAQFVIPLGNNYSIGIGEIFNTLSAALGGPIAVIITVVVTGIGHYLLNMNLYTETWFTNLALADAFIHMFAMLLVAICYYRVLYLRTKKISVFIGGWWLTIGVYYYLALLPLQVALLNYVDPGFGASYPSFAKIFFPEFLGTAAITTLIWLASPARYRRPQWISPKGAPDHSDEIQTNGKKVHNDR